MMTSTPLKLFWWNDQPNFGDTISRKVVEYVSGRPVVWAKPKQCDVFGVGSILQIARRTHQGPRADGSKPWIWGSGCMGALRKDFKDNVQFSIVRGPITASLMNVEMDVFGDPGILVCDAMAEEIIPGNRIALVPHHSQLADPAYEALAASVPALKLIDVRGDALQVCREIASCRYVISSSLHGLIVADSFGIQNTWLDPSGIHASPQLKFFDYAASVERALPPPLTIADISEHIRRIPETELPYADGIERSKQALVDHFPAGLRANLL